jgi:hypothetical protein
MNQSQGKTELKREGFADGTALVTYADGSQLILESRLARHVALREARAVNYNDPPPAPQPPPARCRPEPSLSNHADR